MKIFIRIICIYLCIFNIASAKDRTPAEAIQAAGQFINQQNSTLKKVPASTVSTLSFAYASIKPVSQNKAFYYVYNKGNDNGYVIISGDDRAKTILGYSDNGHFDISDLPENAKEWLKFYENEIGSLPENETQTIPIITSGIKKVGSSETVTAVSPLLGKIKWNQSTPYNNLCPVIDSVSGERAVSGCVATGMAQVMRYHKWPSKGTGSNSYTTTTLKIPLSLDFSKTTFDWDNMSETYGTANTATQNNAVATLIYNCGVSVSMDYGETSSASAKTMAIALKTYFGYDSNLQYYTRDYFNRTEWMNLIKTELNAARPVLYRGSTTTSGHLFVCDGYDSNNLFHFNWGWGGASDGYYQISALDPDNQGIGGSTDGYNGGQGIVTGVQKPSTSSVPSYLIHTYQELTASADSVTRNATFSIYAKKMYNLGVNLFTGNVGIALYSSTGLVQVLKSASVTNLKNDYGWTSYTVSTTIPSSIPNGTYKLYYVYKASTESSWQIVKGKIGTPNYMNVTVNASYIYFKKPLDVYPVLKSDSLSITGNLYQNKTGRFNVKITNSGAEYNSYLGIYLQSTYNDTVYQLVTYEPVNIATGETRELTFNGTITLNPGQYKLSLLNDPGNNTAILTDLYPYGEALTVNVLAEPSGEPALTINDLISFPNQPTVEKNNATLTAKIKNTSGFYDNKLIAFIFPASGGYSLTYLGYQTAIFDTNEEKTVTFSGPIDLEPAQYLIGVYYRNSSGVWTRMTPSDFSMITFNLVDNQTSTKDISQDKRLNIYPNPVSNVLYLKTDFIIRKIVITDLTGKQLITNNPLQKGEILIPVENLRTGTYLIRMETESEVTTKKFTKF